MGSLTVIAPDQLPYVLADFAARLRDYPQAHDLFGEIVASLAVADHPRDTAQRRTQAIGFAHSCGISTLDENPQDSFSWDGTALRVRCEPWVIFHEVAHWSLCPDWRRNYPDFGLGPGPESGHQTLGKQYQCVNETTRQQEETWASLLGVVFEVRCGQPGILSFLEQNWLEGHQRPTTIEHFVVNVAALSRQGYL